MGRSAYLDDAVKLWLQGRAAVAGEAAKEDSLDLEVCQRAGLVAWEQLKVSVKQPLRAKAPIPPILLVACVSGLAA